MGDDLAAVFAFVLMAGFAAYAKRYAVAGVFVLVVDSVAGHGAPADACLLEAHKHLLRDTALLLTQVYWWCISTRFTMPCIPNSV